MAIPTMDLDLGIIQKLSDLPNAYDGLSAEELKAKFDEAGLEIKDWLNNTLIPALKAAGIPFDKTNEIDAANIQDAIVDVQAQIKDAATGTIVNGSVTKEKLAAELLSRIYGGCTWVSMNEPGSSDNVDAGFPLGQMWLRKGYTLHNYAKTSKAWTVNNGTMTDGVFAGDKTAKTATATFACNPRQDDSGAGVGQTVAVGYTISDIGSEVTSLTAETTKGITGYAETVTADAGFNYFETTLMQIMKGAVNVTFTTNWGSASVASDGWTISNLAIVNVDEIQAQLGDSVKLADWKTLLESLGDFTDYTVPDALFIQVGDGVWWQFGVASELTEGYARVQNGKPQWVDREAVISDLGVMRLASGSYTGDGKTSRTLELGVVPKVLFIGRTKAPAYSDEYGYDNGVTLQQGTICTMLGDSTAQVKSTVALKDSTLTFTMGAVKSGGMAICNEADTEYVWTAIY